MKSTYLLSAATGLLALTMTACGGAAEESTAPATYTLDSEASSLEWKGDAADGSHSHNGTVKVTEGTLVYEGEAFKSGAFKVDLNTADSELDEATGESKLLGHLGTPDYFNWAKFPVVDVTITALTEEQATVSMKIAGKTMESTFPVKTKKTDKKVTVKGKFDMDFTSLNSKGFTPDPEMEKQHKGSYTSPLVHFDLDLVLNGEEAKK